MREGEKRGKWRRTHTHTEELIFAICPVLPGTHDPCYSSYASALSLSPSSLFGIVYFYLYFHYILLLLSYWLNSYILSPSSTQTAKLIHLKSTHSRHKDRRRGEDERGKRVERRSEKRTHKHEKRCVFLSLPLLSLSSSLSLCLCLCLSFSLCLIFSCLNSLSTYFSLSLLLFFPKCTFSLEHLSCSSYE